MKKYEYQVLDFSHDSYHSFEMWLNGHGDEGWKAVSVNNIEIGYSTGKQVVFCREVKE